MGQEKILNLEEVLKKGEIIVIKKGSFSKMEKANNIYNNLVSKGMIKKRGNTLKGIQDSHLFFTTISY